MIINVYCLVLLVYYYYTLKFHFDLKCIFQLLFGCLQLHPHGCHVLPQSTILSL